MQILTFRSSGGRKYSVRLPEFRQGLKSAYLFSFHKSGSTLMDSMVRDYCQPLGIPTFSLFNSAFDSGIPTNEIQGDAKVCFTPTGCIYTGFRHFPRFDLDLADVNTILLVRDPRDMLVSMYFSVTKSHVVPFYHQAFKRIRAQASQMELDEFAIKKAGEYLKSFHLYREKLPADSLVTYRYEDVIYKKKDWLKGLVNHVELPKNRKLIRVVADKHDVFPEREDESKHIRQVHPGNFRKRLQPATIERLDEILAPFLDFYGYERGGR